MFYDQILEAVTYIQSKINRKPSYAIVLGSGLDAFVDNLLDKEVISYSSIPYFPS